MLLDLDKYLEDIEIHLKGEVLHVEAISNEYANRFIASMTAQDKDIEKIQKLVIEFLNKNREGKVFTEENINNEFTFKQLRALMMFITSEITGIEKN
ncbi:hypothetical protein HMPREF1092_00924 [Clostridium thermobutyricum]|uniref:Phage protein n=1 Tax=Clostridium thermobutyricum TaxID=29372 RepID=N9WFR4_9CLOT|nr:hypothetical protein [Clostridium thermobutyricum]ENZ01690.1 hypothetical protein HMPREF1092_00924 [Clostridium thermobutyricum]